MAHARKEVRQCSFIDPADGLEYGGLYVSPWEGYHFIICGCCGAILDPKTVKDINFYNEWVDLSGEILGY